MKLALVAPMLAGCLEYSVTAASDGGSRDAAQVVFDAAIADGDALDASASDGAAIDQGPVSPDLAPPDQTPVYAQSVACGTSQGPPFPCIGWSSGTAYGAAQLTLDIDSNNVSGNCALIVIAQSQDGVAVIQDNDFSSGKILAPIGAVNHAQFPSSGTADIQWAGVAYSGGALPETVTINFVATTPTVRREALVVTYCGASGVAFEPPIAASQNDAYLVTAQAASAEIVPTLVYDPAPSTGQWHNSLSTHGGTLPWEQAAGVSDIPTLSIYTWQYRPTKGESLEFHASEATLSMKDTNLVRSVVTLTP